MPRQAGRKAFVIAAESSAAAVTTNTTANTTTNASAVGAARRGTTAAAKPAVDSAPASASATPACADFALGSCMRAGCRFRHVARCASRRCPGAPACGLFHPRRPSPPSAFVPVTRVVADVARPRSTTRLARVSAPSAAEASPRSYAAAAAVTQRRPPSIIPRRDATARDGASRPSASCPLVQAAGWSAVVADMAARAVGLRAGAVFSGEEAARAELELDAVAGLARLFGRVSAEAPPAGRRGTAAPPSERQAAARTAEVCPRCFAALPAFPHTVVALAAHAARHQAEDRHAEAERVRRAAAAIGGLHAEAAEALRAEERAARASASLLRQCRLGAAAVARRDLLAAEEAAFADLLRVERVGAVGAAAAARERATVAEAAAHARGRAEAAAAAAGAAGDAMQVDSDVLVPASASLAAAFSTGGVGPTQTLPATAEPSWLFAQTPVSPTCTPAPVPPPPFPTPPGPVPSPAAQTPPDVRDRGR